MRKIPTDQSFFDLLTPVPESGCLLWFGHWGHKGYGRIHSVRLGGQQAHRFAWELKNGHIPDGIHVLHKCDTPPCCNPDHLFLGTNLDNVADKMRKGRQGRAIGEVNRSAKLVEADVHLIVASAEGNSALAKRLGVSIAAVREVRNGKTWTHVTGLSFTPPPKIPPAVRPPVPEGDQRGTRKVNSKLNDDAVRDIRASGLTNQAISEKYGVCIAIISDVRRFKRWAHVE